MAELIREKEIVLYETNDGKVSFEVNVLDETIWITQEKMSKLFDRGVPTINEHIKNIFKEKELDENSVIRKFRMTASDGKSYLTNHYNLDVIISVGYRVKSTRGTQFRQWATLVLRNYMMNGVAINDRRISVIEQHIKVLSEKIENMKSSANLYQEKAILEQQIENKVQRDKVLQLSDRVGELCDSIESFKNNYVVIKRPEEGGGQG